MKRILWLTLLLTLAAAVPTRAAQKNGGLAASYVMPADALKDVQDPGYGLGVIFDYRFTSSLDITGSISRYNFAGRTLAANPGLETESISFWEFSAGPQLELGPLYVGLEGGYYTRFKEWGYVPNIGLRRQLLDLSLRYKATEDAKFYSVRLGLFF